MTIRTLVIDDEPLARRRILSLLKDDREVAITGECGDGATAIRMARESKPDLLFLDVQMSGIDGFGVLEALTAERLPEVIFVTAFDHYAVKAFDSHAIDYLLKPYKQARFYDAVTRAKRSISEAGTRSELLRLLEKVRQNRDRVIFRAKGRTVMLRETEVEWVEAAANYVRVHAGDRNYTIRETLNEFERSLPPFAFLRIHRSIVVNLDFVAEIQDYGGGEAVVILRNGRELPIGRSYREKLRDVIS